MNEKYIWEYLMGKIGNAYGVAAVMGNLMAESSLSPVCATSLKRAGYDSITQYIADSDSGKHDFAHDGVAFGLAQWCYYSRKQAFLDYAKKLGGSVSAINVQLEYLWKEMSEKYKTVWAAVCQANDIRGASDIIMLKYEKPATTTEAAKKKRADYGQKFYDQFATARDEDIADAVNADKQDEPKLNGKKTVRAKVNVNVREGDSKNYAIYGLLQKGQEAQWVATAENGWFAIRFRGQVGWVCNEFAERV